MYLLVEFTDNSELAVVPDSWLEGSQCAVWPPYKSSTRLIKAVINKEPPTESWKAYPIRILYKNELYDKVRSKLKRAEVESDLQTETDEQPINQGRPNRRKRSLPRYSSSSEDEIPSQAPKKPAKQMPSGLPVPPRYLEIQASSTSASFTPLPLGPSQDSSRSLNMPDSLSSKRSVPSHQHSTNEQGSATSHVPHTAPSPITCTPRSQRSQLALPKSPVASGSGLLSPKAPVSSGLARDVRLFTMIEKIMEEQRHHTSLLNALFSRLGDNDASELEDGLPEGINFPIQSKEEMKSFEEKLKENNTDKLVVNYMASIGGYSSENMAYRIFRHTLSNSCCREYNWTGTGIKDKFESLKLPVLVKRAVMRSFRLVTSAKIEKMAKSFLKSAGDRDGGRKKRMKKPTCTNMDITNHLSDTD